MCSSLIRATWGSMLAWKRKLKINFNLKFQYLNHYLRGHSSAVTLRPLVRLKALAVLDKVERGDLHVPKKWHHLQKPC